MPITPEQREARRDVIGGSDVPRIMLGEATTVWLEKTRRIADFEENEAMRMGNLLETVALDFAAQRLGSLVRNQTVPACDLDFPLAVNCDAQIAANHEPVEAKTTGIVGPTYGEWGDDGTDAVPARVVLQVTAQMIATKTRQAHVPALIGGRGFVMFTIPLDAEIAQAIIDACRRFWNENVIGDVQPSDFEPRLSEEVARRVRRVPGSKSPLIVDAAVVDAWMTAREYRLRWEKAEEAAKEEILAALSSAESVEDSAGRLLTYMAIKSKRFDLDLFRGEHADLAKQFTAITESRSLKLSKEKA